MSAALFEIESGILAFQPVDKSVPGYTDDWLAPGGKGVEDVTIADYDPNAQAWSCQTTAGTLTPTADTTTRDVAATFCEPGETIPTPGKSTWTLDVEMLQDVTLKNGLVRYLVQNDTLESYFLLGLDAENPPKAIGRVRVSPAAFGGPARSTLTATLTMPCTGAPQFLFGTAGDSEAVPPTTTVPPAATGATAGTPGTWTPSGSIPPADAAGANTAAIVASPTTAWVAGEYVQGSTAGVGGEMYWNGSAWTAGRAV
jgi:hypothetical protein